MTERVVADFIAGVLNLTGGAVGPQGAVEQAARAVRRRRRRRTPFRGQGT